jgi:crotonobetainyl-CoA:carnitine CoA-transferase CaiB-like acyl-CoA transferase
LAEVLEDPVFREREMILDTTDPEGRPAPAIGMPVKLSETPGALRHPPVRFGDSTAAVLAELGYSREDIQELADQGVI